MKLYTYINKPIDIPSLFSPPTSLVPYELITCAAILVNAKPQLEL